MAFSALKPEGNHKYLKIEILVYLLGRCDICMRPLAHSVASLLA